MQMSTFSLFLGAAYSPTLCIYPHLSSYSITLGKERSVQPIVGQYPPPFWGTTEACACRLLNAYLILFIHTHEIHTVRIYPRFNSSCHHVGNLVVGVYPKVRLINLPPLNIFSRRTPPVLSLFIFYCCRHRIMSKGEDIGCAHRTAIASGDGCRASVLGARTGSVIPPPY